MRRCAQVAPIPADIQDRRVEITGPVDRKMVINALNSGASVYMADFEDSNAPTWCARAPQAALRVQVGQRGHLEGEAGAPCGLRGCLSERVLYMSHGERTPAGLCHEECCAVHALPGPGLLG